MAQQVVAEHQSMTPQQQEYFYRKYSADQHLELFRSYALTDFWFHLWNVVYRNARQYYSVKRHKPVADWLQSWVADRHGVQEPIGEKLFSAFRTFRKSQMAIAWESWEIARDTNVKIMCRSFKDDEAFKPVKKVGEIITGNDMYRSTYPWVKPATDGGKRLKWSENEFLVERDDSGVKTSTMAAFGLGSDNTGNHYNIAVYDDWEALELKGQGAKQQDMIEKFRTDSNLMLAGFKRLIVGTPYIPGLFMDAAIRGSGIFKDRKYDKFIVRAEEKAFALPFKGQEPVLLPDRVTVRCEGEDFPQDNDGLRRCQAALSFFSDAIGDVVTEKREIEWNDSTHFRVNRAFQPSLNQPLTWEVSSTKVSCPVVSTYDSVDVLTEYRGKPIIRKSLVNDRAEQGPAIYSAQMMLEPTGTDSALFRRDQVKVISADELPKEGDRNWYRIVDLASSTKTKCKTAITTGFLHETGMYIVHGVAGDFKKSDILLEMFRGQIRVHRVWQGDLRWTCLEMAGREEYLGEDLRIAQEDPYGYFKVMKGKYADIAEEEFRILGRIPIRQHIIKRSPTITKGQRRAGLQTWYEQGKIHILDTVDYLDDYLLEVDTATEDDNIGFDIHDNLADMKNEGLVPYRHEERVERRHDALNDMKRARVNGYRKQLLAWRG